MVLDELHAGLDASECAGDIAGTATVLGAPLPLLIQLTPRSTRRLGQRRAAFDWHDSWEPRPAMLGRCADTDPCPACRDGEPCPLDTWPAAWPGSPPCPSGRFDEDGNPIPLRRHHPETPKRTRPTRFVRED